MDKKLIYGGIAVLAVVLFFGLAKIRTWLGLAKESLTEQIDKAVGEYKVKQAEVKTAIGNLEGSIRTLMEGKIKSEVQAEQLTGQLGAVNEQRAAAQVSLTKLRDLIAKNEPATLSGKTYTVAELQAMADKVIAGYKSLETQGKGIQRARDLLADNAKSLGVKMESGKASISAMKGQVAEIDAKILALNTMQDAARTAGADSESLAANFKDVQSQVNSLYANVETKLRIEEESWKQSGAGTAGTDVEDIVRQTQDTSSTLSKIDDILGKR